MTHKSFIIMLGFALVFTMMAIAPPAARANEANQATQLTFDQPFRTPGNRVLGTGTYWFIVPESINETNIVQIYNADRTKLIATFQTIPTVRPEANGKTEFTFAKQSQNRPVDLLSWYYPDRVTGHEFLYSPREESRIAEGQQVTVMAQPTELVDVG